MKFVTTFLPDEIKKEIVAFSFFKDFPSHSLDALAKMFKVQNFEPGEFILKQGQPNETLYFLRYGQLDVLVDGEKVSYLNIAGEVLGEMSLINKGRVKASVQVLKETSVFSVHESHFAHLPEIDREAFKSLTNQVLTQVLVNRLECTNDRAKRFETTNKELEETKDNLQKLNQNLELEISRRSQELVQKVKSISDLNLAIIAKEMHQVIQDKTQFVDIEKCKHWSDSITEAVELLKPVIDLSLRSGQNQFRRVFLCAANRTQQSIATLALGGTGVALTVFSDGAQVVTALQKETADLIIIDAEMVSAIGEIKQQWPSLSLVIMLGQDIAVYLDLLKRFPSHPYFVARNPDNRALTIKSLTTTVAKILNNDIFGFEKYLSWGAYVVESKITHSEARRDEIEKMKQHFKTMGVRSTFLDQAHLVADEMLMNAIYDAPTDAEGKALYNHMSRLEAVQLNDDQAVTLRYGTDGVFLAVSVSDPFGSLTKTILQTYLHKNFQGEETGSEGKGGAGKGLYMIITCSDFVVFNVKAQKKTEVICFFQLERNRDEDPKPTFHLFF